MTLPTPRVTFADVVELVITELVAELPAAGWPDTVVAATVPNPRPDELVRVRRVGGARSSTVTDAALVTVEAYAGQPDDPVDAHDLAQAARSIVHAMPGGGHATPVYRVVEVAGPAHLPDPDSTTPRYSFTVTVTVRAA